jgi:RNA polymerase sigma factor (sigma-70 family)
MSGRAEARPSSAPDEAAGPSEAALLEAIAAGEKWAADALYDLLYPSVAASLQRVLQRPESDYEDLVQTTFERIVRLLFERRGADVLNLRAWASGVATHVALDALRSRVRERKLFDQSSSSSGAVLAVAGSASLERHLEARHQLGLVQDVLARMSPDLAEALVLHDLNGHELSEVATLMNTSLAATQSRVFRARKELLRRVEKRQKRGAE